MAPPFGFRRLTLFTGSKNSATDDGETRQGK